ncbi:response regulator transcription factor [Streptomyces lonarensis]|uniref:Response regulator transcription factor n=2 Tax=Streptomyces lonarensis TaxID=700599 RepID=A0A7X6CXZ5_9ACTN|nr:response regulator transcription factor [Streptomyces lonarensis]
MVRVLAIDDEALVREALRLTLSTIPDFSVSVSAPADALATASEAGSDIALLDVAMPGHDWLDLLASLRALTPRPAVAILTSFEVPGQMDLALRAGATGFLLKDMHPEFLAHSLRTVAAGGMVYVPPASASTIARVLTRSLPERHAPALPCAITQRERDVLTLLALGLQNADIARQLDIGTTTVKTHIGVLKRKLSVPNRVVLARLAQQAGLV